MKPSRVFWGSFFVLLGLLLLADRLGYFTFWLPDLWRFWPLVLVLIGVSLLLRASKIRWVALAAGGVLLAFIGAGALLYFWVGPGEEEERVSEQHYAVPYGGGEKASLYFCGGAGRLEIEEGDSSLVDAVTRSSFGEYRFEYDSTTEGHHLDLMFEGGHGRWRAGRFENTAMVKLHPGPLWDIDIDMGASRLDMDLSGLAVRRLALDCGASRTTLRLGGKAEVADISINAGASTLTIDVPDSVGCRLFVEAPLSTKKFPGFEKLEKGEYETEGFAAAARKIEISFHGGVSTIRVRRY